MTDTNKVIKLVIPGDIRRKFKALCANEGTNMTEKLERYMLEEIERSK
jgi:hypothetical protein